MKYRFPASDPTEPKPSDPKAEPTREQLLKRPEAAAEQMQRTRRYFRLTRHKQPKHYARGLWSDPNDFAPGPDF